MDVRKRKGGRQAELIDRDEQDKLVEELRVESEKQQAQIERIFGYLGRVAAVLSLLLALLVQVRQTTPTTAAVLLGWTHALLAALLHFNATGSSKITSSSLPHDPTTPSLAWNIIGPLFLSALVAGFGLFVARRRNDEDRIRFHYSLLLSNLVVLLGAMWVRHERFQSEQSIRRLHAAKYHYKSL